MSNQEKDSLIEKLAESIEGPRGPINPFDVTDIAQALGASVAIPVSSPAEAVAIYRSRQTAIREESRLARAREHLADDVIYNLVPRLESTGGRPTVPEWSIARVTGYAPSTWEQLQEVAKLASTDERKVSPAQIASFLIEKSLAEYE